MSRRIVKTWSHINPNRISYVDKKINDYATIHGFELISVSLAAGFNYLYISAIYERVTKNHDAEEINDE